MEKEEIKKYDDYMQKKSLKRMQEMNDTLIDIEKQFKESFELLRETNIGINLDIDEFDITKNIEKMRESNNINQNDIKKQMKNLQEQKEQQFKTERKDNNDNMQS